MIRAAYVLISSILAAAIYTLIITVFRDRIMEIIFTILHVPDDSEYSIVDITNPMTWCLYAVPVIMVLFGFAYLALAGPRRESDTYGYTGGYYR
jgi:hypothetical protein